MASIGVGLIGTGYMGKCHALAWTSVHAVFGDGPAVRLEHLVEVTPALAAQRAGEFGFARSGADWHSLMADPKVDVVSITTPNQFHAEMAIATLEAGKHVWCEKPMALTEAECSAMIDACRKNKKSLAIGYRLHHEPNTQEWRRIVKEKQLGKVTKVTCAAGYFETRTNHWKQAVHFFPDPVTVRPGDRLDIAAGYDATRIFFNLLGTHQG